MPVGGINQPAGRHVGQALPSQHGLVLPLAQFTRRVDGPPTVPGGR
jgi:hypothetical protein